MPVAPAPPAVGVVAVAVDAVVRGETYHAVRAYVAGRKAYRTVVVDLLFGVNPTVVPAARIVVAVAPPAPVVVVLADLTVGEVERVAVGLPYHGLFDNARAELTERFYGQFYVLQRTNHQEGIDNEYRRGNGARRRGGHLEADVDGVGRGGVPSRVHIAQGATFAARRTVDKPFKLGRVATAANVGRPHGDIFKVADGVASRTEVNSGVGRYIIHHVHHHGVGSGRVVGQRATVRTVFGRVVRVVENGLNLVARFERIFGPEATIAAFFKGHHLVVEIPLIYRRLAFVGRTHVEGYRVVGADVGARVGVNVYHHPVALDELNDDDVGVNFAGVYAGVVAGEAATDIAEVAQIFGGEDRVGGTRYVAAVDGPLIFRVGTAVGDGRLKGGLNAAALGYDRGVANGEARTIDGDGGRYRVANTNQNSVVANAGAAVGVRNINGEGVARGGVGAYKPVFHGGLFAAAHFAPTVGVERAVADELEGEVCLGLREVALTQHGVALNVEFGYHLNKNGSRVKATILVLGFYFELALLPNAHTYALRGFAAVQPLVGYYIGAGGRKHHGFGAAGFVFAGRGGGVGELDVGLEVGRVVHLFGTRVVANHFATNRVARINSGEGNGIARLTLDFHFILEPLVGGNNIAIVGLGHEGKRVGAASRAVGHLNVGVELERLAEQYRGHGGGVGLAHIGMVHNGAVVVELTGYGRAGNAGIARCYGGGRLPCGAVQAFLPFDKVEVSGFGQEERIGQEVANSRLGGRKLACLGFGIEAEQHHVARPIANAVVGHAANIGGVFGENGYRVVARVVRSR